MNRPVILAFLALLSTLRLAEASVWECFGPPTGGEILTLTQAPADPEVLYAGTRGGGVYKSIDRGESWRPANQGLINATVYAIAIDPRTTATVYLATSGGLLKTTDGARTWHAPSPDFGVRSPRAVAVQPGSPEAVFVGADKLYYSRDAGATWAAVEGSQPVKAMAFAGPDGEVLVTDRGVYRTGRPVPSLLYETGLPNGAQALAVDPSDGDVVYAASGGEFLRSRDGGRTWQVYPIGVYGSVTINALSLAVDPHDPGVLYAGTQRGLYRSVDRGESWETLHGPLNTPTNILSITEAEKTHTVLTVLADRADPHQLYVGTQVDGVFRRRPGSSWRPSNTGLSSAPIASIQVNAREPDIVYAVGNDQVFRSDDRGREWTGVLRIRAKDDMVDAVVMAPAHPDVLYTTGWLMYLRRTEDGGANWAMVGGDMRMPGPMVVSWQNPDVLYSGESWGAVLEKSEDGGKTWIRLDTGLREKVSRLTAMTLDPTNDRIVYVGTDKGVFKTADGAETWTHLAEGLPPASVSALAIDPVDPAVVYAGVARTVYRSDDGATTWQFAGSGLPEKGSLTSLAIHPRRPQQVYAGTGGGVWLSTDAGRNWSALNAGLTSTSVKVLAIDPAAGNTLYAGTGHGCFVLSLHDDTAVGGDAPQRAPDRFSVEQNYPNPFNAQTTIPFVLPISGTAYLAVYNLAGQQVATLARGPHTAGPHIVRWDGQDDDGRALASGVYICRLRVEGLPAEVRRLMLVR